MQARGPKEREHELKELARIYERRGLPKDLALQVAIHYTKNDAVRAHARDELGIDIDRLAKPLHAAFESALAFLIGAAIPLLAASFIHSYHWRIVSLVLTTTAAQACFGSLGASLAGSNIYKGAVRLIVGG